MVRTGPIRHYVITAHALWEIGRRDLDLEVVRRTVREPEQRLEVGPGRVVCQSRWTPSGMETEYLVRVVVDVDRDPPEVVTAYRTTKIRKYWSSEA